MKKKLQEIIEGCKHPKARAFFETLFARHDEIMESLTGRANGNIVDEIAGQYENVVDFNEALQGVQWDDDDEDEEFDFIAGQSCEEVIKQLDELGPDVLDRYKDRANSQLRRCTSASKFTKPAVQAKKRANRLQGVKRASSRLNTFNNDEHSNTTNEGLGSAIGNALKGVATHAVASGLGVSHGSVSSFLHHLSAKQKYVAPKVSAQKPPHAPKPQKPQQHQPQASHSTTKWEPVELHHVYSGKETEHEHSLQQALNHHNIATFNKSKGDNSKAEIHFRARDKHFKTYVTTAPRENLKKLNQDKVKSIFT